MSRTPSPSTGKPYGVAQVLAVWDLPRSTFYAAKDRAGRPTAAQKRGRRSMSDTELLAQIQAVISYSPFHGEGYRKVWARLRHKGMRVWKERVLRIMRENSLLSPCRQPDRRPTNPHEGTIGADTPNQIWGTDATAAFTVTDGQVTIFAAIDHCTAECIGIHVVKRATRYEALEPIRQALRQQFGVVTKSAAAGTMLRHDHGSVYMSRHFQDEIAFFGLQSSPSFVRQPEGNGCIERFFRTLKEQLLWIRHFASIDDLRTDLSEFRVTYNHHWIIERLGYKTPAQARAEFDLALERAA